MQGTLRDLSKHSQSQAQAQAQNPPRNLNVEVCNYAYQLKCYAFWHSLKQQISCFLFTVEKLGKEDPAQCFHFTFPKDFCSVEETKKKKKEEKRQSIQHYHTTNLIQFSLMRSVSILSLPLFLYCLFLLCRLKPKQMQIRPTMLLRCRWMLQMVIRPLEMGLALMAVMADFYFGGGEHGPLAWWAIFTTSTYIYL